MEYVGCYDIDSKVAVTFAVKLSGLLFRFWIGDTKSSIMSKMQDINERKPT